VHVYVESDPVVGEQFRAVVLSRARTAARRLSYALTQAKLKFTQVFLSSGASEQHCRVELTVGDTSTVVATAHAANWRDALDGALRRATSALPGINRRNRLHSRHHTTPGSDAGRQLP